MSENLMIVIAGMVLLIFFILILLTYSLAAISKNADMKMNIITKETFR